MEKALREADKRDITGLMLGFESVMDKIMKKLLSWECNSIEDVANLLGVKKDELYVAMEWGNQIPEKDGRYLEVSERGVIQVAI